jgi:hypothetical protein
MHHLIILSNHMLQEKECGAELTSSAWHIKKCMKKILIVFHAVSIIIKQFVWHALKT